MLQQMQMQDVSVREGLQQLVVVIAVVQQQLPLDDLALELKGLVPRRVSVQIVRREGGAALQYEVAQLVSPW